jgi:hypothetical protein
MMQSFFRGGFNDTARPLLVPSLILGARSEYQAAEKARKPEF